jgi:hypothetical protein
MIRNLIVAAALLTASAAGAQSISVPVTGRSLPDVRRDVHAAAVKVCKVENRGSFEYIYTRPSCVRRTTKVAMAKISAAPDAVAPTSTFVAAR